MYLYVYDESVIKNESVLHKIEKRLTDLGLNGQIVKPGVSRNIKTAIKDKINQGAKTIVAVGNDETISSVINIVASDDSDHKGTLTIGLIPLEKNSIFSTKFGINNVDDACKILLARRLETFNLARINENYFLFDAQIENSNTSILEIDKKYTIQTLSPSNINIENNYSQKNLTLKISSKEGATKIKAHSILIVDKNNSIVTDSSFINPAPVLIIPGDDNLKIIVGKNRKI